MITLYHVCGKLNERETAILALYYILFFLLLFLPYNKSQNNFIVQVIRLSNTIIFFYFFPHNKTLCMGVKVGFFIVIFSFIFVSPGD